MQGKAGVGVGGWWGWYGGVVRRAGFDVRCEQGLTLTPLHTGFPGTFTQEGLTPGYTHTLT